MRVLIALHLADGGRPLEIDWLEGTPPHQLAMPRQQLRELHAPPVLLGFPVLVDGEVLFRWRDGTAQGAYLPSSPDEPEPVALFVYDEVLSQPLPIPEEWKR